MSEIDDPDIRRAMSRILATASHTEVHQTVVDLAATVTALCSVLAEAKNTTTQDVLDCALAR
jgi:hypothetical protein